jgi:hypothetical protein
MGGRLPGIDMAAASSKTAKYRDRATRPESKTLRGGRCEETSDRSSRAGYAGAAKPGRTRRGYGSNGASAGSQCSRAVSKYTNVGILI